MNNHQKADLCMALMRAETDAEVVELLTRRGLWDSPSVWRFLGDIENNYSTIGNQQAEPIAALAEKLVNGIDARLVDACLGSGIDPSGDDAPVTIKAAVARFFGRGIERNGQIVNWDPAATLREGLLLTVAATGNMPPGCPSISIADGGEGQTPDAQPKTFMSIHRSNKLRIPFVQGKFNMGGTGALNFCSSPNRLQLVVSRRNPSLLPADASERDRQWGFTVVRREPSGRQEEERGVHISTRPREPPIETDKFWHSLLRNGRSFRKSTRRFGTRTAECPHTGPL